jgi:hypothetical protein
MRYVWLGIAVLWVSALAALFGGVALKQRYGSPTCRGIIDPYNCNWADDIPGYGLLALIMAVPATVVVIIASLVLAVERDTRSRGEGAYDQIDASARDAATGWQAQQLRADGRRRRDT